MLRPAPFAHRRPDVRGAALPTGHFVPEEAPGLVVDELRVAGLGVQVLFGFLLSLPFTSRFTRLSAGQRDLYLASLVLAAVATALLVGPAAPTPPG